MAQPSGCSVLSMLHTSASIFGRASTSSCTVVAEDVCRLCEDNKALLQV